MKISLFLLLRIMSSFWEIMILIIYCFLLGSYPRRDMMKRIKTVKINEYKEIRNNIDVEYNEYLNPEYVYYSIDNCECLKNKGDYVFLGEKILLDKENDLYIHSSVSGYIEEEQEEMLSKSNQLANCLKIKNDYKEVKSSDYHKIDVLDKESLIKLLKEKGIVGLGGGGFPAYKKIANDINTLIVNACECEPFLNVDKQLIYLKYKEIIKCLKTLIKLLDLNKVYIALKNTKLKLINLLNKEIRKNSLEEYIKIRLMKDAYPVGYERYLINDICKKYDFKYPSDINVCVFNVYTIYSIFEAIELGKPLIEKMVSFNGDGIEKAMDIYLKIGTNLKELNEKINKFINKDEKMYLIVGGPMTGESLRGDLYAIGKTDSNFTLMNLKEKYQSEACMGCGRCNLFCPVSLTPILILDAYKRKDKDEIKKLNVNKCVNCGICSYVCPSRLELTSTMQLAKKQIMKRGKYDENK